MHSKADLIDKLNVGCEKARGYARVFFL